MFGLVPVRAGSRDARAATTSPTRAAHELVERGVGYVPQVDNVFPSLTIDDNLRMGAYLAAAATSTSGATTSSSCFPLLGERRTSAPGRSRAASARCSPWRAR